MHLNYSEQHIELLCYNCLLYQVPPGVRGLCRQPVTQAIMVESRTGLRFLLKLQPDSCGRSQGFLGLLPFPMLRFNIISSDHPLVFPYRPLVTSERVGKGTSGLYDQNLNT